MKTAFLDLDGTLINSSQRHKIVLEAALQKSQIIDINIDDYLEYKREGKTTKNYLTEKKGMTEQLAQKVCSDWSAMIEDESYLSSDILYDDAVEFLKFLKYENYKIYYLTARRNENYVRRYVLDSDLADYCNQIFVVNPGNATVEKTIIIKKHMQDNTVIIGDSEVDYNAAKGLAADLYLLNRGFRNLYFWNNKGIVSYSSLNEIRSVMLQKNS